MGENRVVSTPRPPMFAPRPPVRNTPVRDNDDDDDDDDNFSTSEPSLDVSTSEPSSDDVSTSEPSLDVSTSEPSSDLTSDVSSNVKSIVEDVDEIDDMPEIDMLPQSPPVVVPPPSPQQETPQEPREETPPINTVAPDADLSVNNMGYVLDNIHRPTKVVDNSDTFTTARRGPSLFSGN